MVKRFFQTVVPSVLQPLRVLWNEVIAFVFLVLGLAMVPYVWRSWKELSTPEGSPGRLLVALLFCSVMLYYAASSYWRARRAARSK